MTLQLDILELTNHRTKKELCARDKEDCLSEWEMLSVLTSTFNSSEPLKESTELRK